jgi:hypothetical protein
MNTHHTHFNPENGGSMYFWDMGNTAHIYKAQRPKSSNINSDPQNLQLERT